MLNRRQFNKSLVAIAMAGLSKNLMASTGKLSPLTNLYGPLLSDPNGLLDLPKGFSYRVISELGTLMSDGRPVPDRADGMGVIPIGDNRIALIRNHEIGVSEKTLLAPQVSDDLKAASYDTLGGVVPLPGGTTTIIYNESTGEVEDQFTSLIGTIRNCSGGITPWGTWLSCEENTATANEYIAQDHGYVFEVDAKVKGAAKAEPIKAMGRFNHEAACVDPRTGIVYLTEDRSDSLLYRYIPKVKGQLAKGGKLQALAIMANDKFDTRNWDFQSFDLNQQLATHWVDLEDVESPNDDLRKQGYEKGAALFARGEGIFWGDNELYFCCTNGGSKKLGQIMKYVPSVHEGSTDEHNAPGTLSLFIESPNEQTFNYGDNVAVAPNGHLIVCEDQYGDIKNNHLKGVTTDGKVYDFAKVRTQTEPAGACFSSDGSTMFVNLYKPTLTLAITGPWIS